MFNPIYRCLITLMLTTLPLTGWSKEVVIDVRTSQEFASGHIEGAINIDHSAIAQEIAKANVTTNDTVILYCRSGRRSEIARDVLSKMGYSKAQNYGGITEAAQRLQRKF